MKSLAKIIQAPITPPMKERIVVRINLQKYGIRTLIYDADAMGYIRKATGKNPLKGEFTPLSITDMLTFLFACTQSSQGREGKLTMKQMEEVLDITHFREAFQICLRLMTNRQPNSEELAPYVASPMSVVKAALDMAKIKAGEVFVDLGCGDGRALALAGKRGAVVYGYETNANRAKISAALIQQLSLTGDVIQENIIKGGWIKHQPSVVFAYLLTDAMKELTGLLEQLNPGTLVVSHDFPIEGWDALDMQVIQGEAKEHKLFLYEVGKHKTRIIDYTKELPEEDANYIAASIADAIREMSNSDESD